MYKNYKLTVYMVYNSITIYSGTNSLAGTAARAWSITTLNKSVAVSTKIGFMASMNRRGLSLKKLPIKSAAI